MLSVHDISQRGHTPTQTSGNSQQPWNCHELSAEAVPLKASPTPSVTREEKGREAGIKKKRYTEERSSSAKGGHRTRISNNPGTWKNGLLHDHAHNHKT